MKLLAIVGLLLVALVAPALPDADIGDEHRLSYCSMLVNKRVYKQERLDVFCSLKVQQWDNQVNEKI